MTPQNAGYATAAYTLAATIYLVYAFSIVARTRRLRARLAQLDANAAVSSAGIR